MSGKVVGWAFDEGEARGLELSRRFVLVAYADNANQDGMAYPSPKAIIGKTGTSRATWYRAKDELVKEGLIEFTEDDRGRECVQLAVPWASHGETDSSQGEKNPSDGLSQPETANSHGETWASHGETGSNKGTVSEPSTNQKQKEDPGDEVREIYDFWKQATGRNGSTELTDGRRRAIKARIAEGRPVPFIKQAIANCAASPFHQGKNDHKRRYDDLTLICRSGEKLEQFAEMGGGTAVAAASDDRGPIADPEGAAAKWTPAKERLEGAVPTSTFRLWLEPLEAGGVRNGDCLVLVDSSEQGKAGWIKRRYSTLILEALEGAYTSIEIVDETQLEYEAR